MKFGKNFLCRELVKTFDYTTATKNRNVYSDVSINGRHYTKYGTLQAVTFVGNLYKIKNGEGYLKCDGPIKKHNNQYILAIGISKQHPCDMKVDKNIGYEVAMENALINPCIVIEVQGKFNYKRFNHIIENYISTLNLSFIKTKEEIIAEGKDPKIYNR